MHGLRGEEVVLLKGYAASDTALGKVAALGKHVLGNVLDNEV